MGTVLSEQGAWPALSISLTKVLTVVFNLCETTFVQIMSRKKTGADTPSTDSGNKSTEPGTSGHLTPVQYNLSLFDSRPDILKKPVQAIHMQVSGGVQNKTQRLAWNAMLKKAQKWHAENPGKDSNIYEIRRSELVEMIGFTSRNYKHLKEVLQQMQKLTVEWDVLKQDGESIWASCVMMPLVSFDKDKVYYSYEASVKPALFSSKIWALVDLSIQRRLKKDAATALYEWVARYKDNPSKRTNIMPWQDWRWVIYGPVHDTSVLHQYKEFNREKLKPAIQEINSKTDLTITLLTEYGSNKEVTNLQFIVEKKATFDWTDPSKDEALELEMKLKDLGVTLRDRKKVLAAYKPEVIEAHYRYTLDRLNDKEQEKVRNVSKYFVHAIEQNYAESLIDQKAEPVNHTEMLDQLESEYKTERSKEASRMFVEMAEEEQEKLIGEYNVLQTAKATVIPVRGKKRETRVMVPFYAWLAEKTWGKPSASDVLSYAIAKGKLNLNK
jgi:hypothetical protein